VCVSFRLGAVRQRSDRDCNPEFMRISGVVFADFKDTYAREDLVRVCNFVNCDLDCSQEVARLTVMDNHSVVRASVALVLAEEGNMPDEELLRSVIVRSMSSIKAAAKEFADELEKQ